MKKLILCILIILPFMSNGQSSAKREWKGPIWLTHTGDTKITGLSFRFYSQKHAPYFNTDEGNTNTYGIRLEISPFSILEVTPFALLDFLSFDAELSNNDKEHKELLKCDCVIQKVYGLNISTGNDEEVDIHGLSITGLLQYTIKNNGIAVAGLSNIIERGNGLMIGGLTNGIYTTNGVVIGGLLNVAAKTNGIMVGGLANGAEILNGIQISTLFNSTKNGVGIQIGIYNIAKNFKGIQLGLWNKNQKRSLPILNWSF